MPESLKKIISRGPIHPDEFQSSDTEELESEQSANYQYDSQSYSHAESDSESEALGRRNKSQTPKICKPKAFEQSNSVAGKPQSPKQHFQQNFSTPSESKSGFWNNGTILGILVLGIVIAVAVAVRMPMNNNPMNNNNTKKECSFKKLQKLYPELNPNVWKYLTVGIESILNNLVKKPGVYLFVHNDGDLVKQHMRDIASHSSSCFGNDMRPVEMESNDFNSDEVLVDYGHAIKKFKQKIKNGNVILIANLNEIPAKAARALHAICDTESPIAPDIVIFLTLTVPDIDRGNANAIAEDVLKQLWGQELRYNELDPLITRVTDQVIALKS